MNINNETYKDIENVALMLSEITGTPLTKNDRDMLDTLKQATNTNALFNQVMKSKCYAEEIEYQSEIFAETPHISIYPLLKLQDKLNNRRYYDILLAMKICNETVLKKSLNELPIKNTPEHIIRQVSIVPLLQMMPLQANDDPHYNFNNALPFRWLVWSLKQLKLPTPSKFTDFEKFFPAVESNDLTLLIKQLKSNHEHFSLHNTLFNRFHTENVLFAYIKVLLHFKDRKLEQLSDDEYNVLSGAMYGYASICLSDVFFYTVTGSIASNVVPLAINYLRTKAMRSSFLMIGDTPESRALILKIVAMTRVIGDKYQDFTNKEFNGEPEEFFDFALKITPILSELKDTLNHEGNILGRMNVYSISVIFSPIIDEICLVMTIKKLFDGMKVSKSITDKLNEFESVSTMLISRLRTEIDSVHQLFHEEGFFDAALQLKNFFDSHYDTFNSAKIYPEFEAAKEDLASCKSRLLQLIEQGNNELAIVELNAITKIEADIVSVLNGVNNDFKEAFELVASLFQPIHDSAAQKMINKANDEAAKEFQLEIETAPSIDLKSHEEMIALHDLHIVELEANIEQLEQKLKKKDLELVAANKTKLKLQQTYSGPSEAFRNVILERLKVADVFTLIEEQFPHVEFSDDFSTYVQTCTYEMPQKLLKLLFILCDEYYLAIIGGTPDSIAKDIIGQCYRANESNTTMQNATLRARREFSFNGEKKLFMRHLTIGSAHDPRKTVQVYFDIVGNTLQMAYVGEHLPLAE